MAKGRSETGGSIPVSCVVPVVLFVGGAAEASSLVDRPSSVSPAFVAKDGTEGTGVTRSGVGICPLGINPASEEARPPKRSSAFPKSRLRPAKRFVRGGDSVPSSPLSASAGGSGGPMSPGSARFGGSCPVGVLRATSAPEPVPVACWLLVMGGVVVVSPGSSGGGLIPAVSAVFLTGGGEFETMTARGGGRA